MMSLEQILGGGVRELAHPEIVDDEQGHRGEVGEQHFARPVERRIGDLFDERVGLAIDDAVALLDPRAADGLGEMAFAGAGRVSYMMPIILRRSPCIIGGIRHTARRCRYGVAHGLGMRSTSSAVSPMTRSVRCRRGCSILPVQSRPSVLP